MDYINLAADLVTQDAGCANDPRYGSETCACTNCKYGDHAGTIIIGLDV